MIVGKQRSGKTFFCVSLIVDYLRHYQKRPLYFNLPINPDILARYAAGKDVILFQEYLRRLHYFAKFNHLSDAKAWHKTNPIYVSLNRTSRDFKDKFKVDGKYNFTLDYYLRSDRLIFPQACITHYWRYTKNNCVTFLDEVYQWFHNSSAFSRDAEMINYRKELLTYTRQHGHSKDDLFLISHDMSDVDVSIRKGVQYLYEVRNSKYTNMFEWRWLRGLKWPIQFFIINGYEFGEKVPSDTFTYRTNQRIFKCYNSFSVAETLTKFSSSDANQQSSDTGVNFWWNLKRFIAQSWIGWLFLISAVFGIYYGYLIITDKNIFDTSVKVSTNNELKKSSDESHQNLDTENQAQNNVIKKVNIIAVTPNSVNWADGFKLKRGDIYNGFKVHQITKNSVIFFARPNNFYTIPLSGSRDYTTDPARTE